MINKCDTESCRVPKTEMLRDACEGQEEECKFELIDIEIDNHKMQVAKGTTILEAAKGIGVKIPTLCSHDDLCLAGVCRICLVEVEGFKTLQASCSYSISQPIKIKTNTAKIRRARRNVLELILADHVGECYSCMRNGKCELQDLAMEYGITSYPYGHDNIRKKGVDFSSHAIMRDLDKCILCRRCVRSCIDLQEVGVFSVKGRGKDSTITTFGDKPMDEIVCINCGQCINRCPTAALYEKDESELVWDALETEGKHVVIQTAPAPRAGIGEEFGLEPGTPMTMKMNTALRRCGFQKVFDTCFTADLTIIEEGTELLKRLYDNIEGDGHTKLPVFTSCSPGWVKYLEHFYPEFIENLSTAKSPQQMFGTIIKTYYAEKNNINPEDIVTVALMPCTAKKYEAGRPEMCQSGYRDVDYGITTREMAKMFKETGIDLPNIEDSDFDDPFTGGSGSGVIFGATGGVMESAIRTLYELVTGEKVDSLFEHGDVKPVRGFENIKSLELKIDSVTEVPELLKGQLNSFEFLKNQTLKVAICHGTSNAKRVLENIKKGGEFSNYHFIEFMACPGGCLGGGGQPIPTNEEIRIKRANAIYSEDKKAAVRKSYENPGVLELYKNFFKEGPGKEKAHKLLHTHYKKRGKEIV
ncbi:NADH-dependent [FeFe] hydrogenase, group A6 [uncultured Ilyobacter sp.]|uniref:NADH-dependent [FeFe] hydrogenase, group A6 n=1 Tax=uncultured Ilyobacter sp. TaxID=544433 RepID=UPI0029F4BE28|nr:NADH-dependent [FeFe] hydrogenase, group A6 [uncultured Ilyobacter sp.]